jgi:hypothetical protein
VSQSFIRHFYHFFLRQSAYLPPTAKSIGKSALYTTNNFTASSRSVTNTMGLPPSFRTFHSNQQPLTPFHPMYPRQVPFPINHPWTNMANEPVSALVNNNGTQAEQQRGAKNRARSVDTGSRNRPPVRSSNVQPQPVVVVEHQNRHRPQPTTNVAPSVENEKEQNVPAV